MPDKLPSLLGWLVIGNTSLASPFVILGVRKWAGTDLMGWCADLLLSEEQRRYDPFGYGMGLGFIYFILPMIVTALCGYLIWEIRNAIKES